MSALSDIVQLSESCGSPLTFLYLLLWTFGNLGGTLGCDKGSDGLTGFSV